MSRDRYSDCDHGTIGTAIAAAQLGLAPHLVRFLVTHRCIPHVRDGDRVRFHPAVLDAWAALCGLPSHPSPVDCCHEPGYSHRRDEPAAPWDTCRESRDDHRGGRETGARPGDDHSQGQERRTDVRESDRGGGGGTVERGGRVYRLDDYRNQRRRP